MSAACFLVLHNSPILTLDHSTVAFRQHSEEMLVQYTTQI